MLADCTDILLHTKKNCYQISLNRTTVSCFVEDMLIDTENSLKPKMSEFKWFSMALVESIDIITTDLSVSLDK